MSPRAAAGEAAFADAIAVNEATVRLMFDRVINGRDLSAAHDVCADDCVLHVPGVELPSGPEGLKEFARRLHAGFDDLHVVIDDVICTEDGVSVRWHTDRQTHTGEYRGLPPTGRSVHVTGTNFYRFESGRITHAWVQADSIGLAQQLGAVPPDGLGSGARLLFLVRMVLRFGYLQARHSARSRSRRRA